MNPEQGLAVDNPFPGKNILYVTDPNGQEIQFVIVGNRIIIYPDLTVPTDEA